MSDPNDAAESESASEITSLLKWWVQYPIIIFITVAAYYIDPFDFEKESANLSNDLVQRFVLGPLKNFIQPQPRRSATEQAEGQNHLLNTQDREQRMSTVILFTDSDLETYKTKWPMPLSLHAKILAQILSVSPKGVFVDFVFYDKRDGDGSDALLEIIQEYEEEGIPLWFARAEGPRIERAIREDLWKGIKGDGSAKPLKPKLTSAVLPDEHGVARTYSPCSRPDWSRTAPESRQCRCVDEESGQAEQCTKDKSKNNKAKTAAFAMYEHARKQKRFAGLREVTQENLDMYVSWDNWENNWNRDTFFPKDEGSDAPRCLPIDGKFIGWLGLLFQGSSFRQPCPYTDTLNATHLHTSLDNEKVQDKLKNRYVFYGGSLTALGDFVNPPTHDRLPAVYLHAMALDNLLEYRGHYKHEQVYFAGSYWARKYIDLPLSLLVVCSVLIFSRNRQRAISLGSNPPASRFVLGPALNIFLTGIAAILAIWYAVRFTGDGDTRPAYVLTILTAFLSIGLWSVMLSKREFKNWTRGLLRLLYPAAVIGAVCIAEFNKQRLNQLDLVLTAVIAVTSVWLIQMLFPPRQKKTENPTPNAPLNQGTWLDLQTLWQMKTGWIRFLICWSLFLIALSAAMFEWWDIARRNWIWVWTMAAVVGTPVVNLWIEHGVNYGERHVLKLAHSIVEHGVSKRLFLRKDEIVQQFELQEQHKRSVNRLISSGTAKFSKWYQRPGRL